jgi:hypothetical protein
MNRGEAEEPIIITITITIAAVDAIIADLAG